MEKAEPVPVANDPYKKQMADKLKKLEKLKKEYPDNEVIDEMYEECERSCNRMNAEKKPGAFWSMVHEAVYAAEKAYQEEGMSFVAATDDLVEAITAAQNVYYESKKKDPTVKNLTTDD